MTPSYCWAGLALLAAGAAAGPPAAAKRAPAGQPMVLLLSTFQVVDGLVEKTATGYRVTRGKDVREYADGQVVFAGESRDAVHKHLLARAGAKPAGGGTPFAAGAQPVLMNLCGACHARPEHPGRFKLTRVPGGYADPDGTRRNAAAAAGFVRPGGPADSPLLALAVTAHGGQKAPAVRDRSHPAYRHLEEWARGVAAPADAAKPVVTPPTGGDPFDPAEFNRAAHPTRGGS